MHLSFISSYLIDFLKIDFREWEKRRARGRKGRNADWCSTYVFIAWFSYVSWLGLNPQPQHIGRLLIYFNLLTANIFLFISIAYYNIFHFISFVLLFFSLSTFQVLFYFSHFNSLWFPVFGNYSLWVYSPGGFIFFSPEMEVTFIKTLASVRHLRGAVHTHRLI